MSVEMVGGRYRLGRPLGSGGMAEVFDAMDERLDRPVAVKLLRADLSGDAGLRRRFEVEARSAARLVHPNVVAVYDTGEVGERPYIVMERLPGATLADRLRQGPMDEGGTRRLASEVLGALAAAHAAGIVHRDVKPSNILWAPDGAAKVADFGIAKGLEPLIGTPTADITATNLVIGTPAYLAPERLAGQPATPQSDMWSLGVVLYEALAGERPFPSGVGLAHDPQRTELAPLRIRRPDVDPVLAGAIDRTLDPDPRRRFSSAAAMAAAAGLALAGGSATASAGGTTRLDRDAVGPTEVMEGPGRTAVLGGRETAVGPPPPAETAAAPDLRARRIRAVAILAALLVGLAVIAVAVLARGNGGSTPGTTTSVPTTGVTSPPTTRAPVTTTTSPRTTTTAPTTTTTQPTTTSSSTTSTSGAQGGNGQAHVNAKKGGASG